MFKKGYTPWNKGKKCPQCGIAHIGKPSWNKGKKLGFIPKYAFKKGQIPWNKGTKGIMKQNSGSFYKGQPPLNWKGGKVKHSDGYIRIYKPKHPFKQKEGYIFEHRFVMEQKLGRFLKPKERVHHLNNIRDDNRIENLILFLNESEHQKFHSLTH